MGHLPPAISRNVRNYITNHSDPGMVRRMERCITTFLNDVDDLSNLNRGLSRIYRGVNLAIEKPHYKDRLGTVMVLYHILSSRKSAIILQNGKRMIQTTQPYREPIRDGRTNVFDVSEGRWLWIESRDPYVRKRFYDARTLLRHEKKKARDWPEKINRAKRDLERRLKHYNRKKSAYDVLVASQPQKRSYKLRYDIEIVRHKIIQEKKH